MQSIIAHTSDAIYWTLASQRDSMFAYVEIQWVTWQRDENIEEKKKRKNITQIELK